MAEKRWPLLANLMACYFNQDFGILYGSLDGAIVEASRDGSIEHRRAILKEWRDWNTAEGAVDDIRPFLDEAFCVDVLFRSPADARTLMSRIYDELLSGVKADTR